ncbi:MAG: hypothetical protein OXG65_15520 [Chloroflexi bacterium]|nr:hypothetical protein [Chloroflexota bacterium]
MLRRGRPFGGPAADSALILTGAQPLVDGFYEGMAVGARVTPIVS